MSTKKRLFLKMISTIMLSILAVSASYTLDCQAATIKGPYTVDATVIEGRRGYVEGDIYHFRNEAVCGITVEDNQHVDYEALAGLKIKTNGTKVTYSAYTHSLHL